MIDLDSHFSFYNGDCFDSVAVLLYSRICVSERPVAVNCPWQCLASAYVFLHFYVNKSVVFDVRPTKRACGAQGLFYGGPTQGRSPHAPGISKNAYGPVGIPLIRGAPGAG